MRLPDSSSRSRQKRRTISWHQVAAHPAQHDVGRHTESVKIRAYQTPDEQAVIALWQECRLTRPWNDPRRDIARKLTEQPELFLVGTYEG